MLFPEKLFCVVGLSEVNWESGLFSNRPENVGFWVSSCLECQNTTILRGGGLTWIKRNSWKIVFIGFRAVGKNLKKRVWSVLRRYNVTNTIFVKLILLIYAVNVRGGGRRQRGAEYTLSFSEIVERPRSNLVVRPSDGVNRSNNYCCTLDPPSPRNYPLSRSTGYRRRTGGATGGAVTAVNTSQTLAPPECSSAIIITRRPSIGAQCKKIRIKNRKKWYRVLRGPVRVVCKRRCRAYAVA